MYSVGVTSVCTVLVTSAVIIQAMGRDLSPYQRLVIGGICYSSCYNQYGSRVAESVQSHHIGLYRPWRCETQACYNCSVPCRMKNYNLTTCESSCMNTQCQESCAVLFKEIAKYQRTGGLRLSSLNLRLSEPEITCMETLGDNARVVLGWHITDQDGSTSLSPLTFVLSIKRGDSKWKAVGQTFSAVVPVTLLDPGQDYSFRITAISTDGIVHAPRDTAVITLLKDGEIGESPKELFVRDSEPADRGVNVLIGWQSGHRPACRLRLYCLPTTCSGESVQEILQDVPNQVWKLQDLKYECNYTVIMHAEGSTQDSRHPVSINFTTPTCLQLSGHNYTFCAPLAPQNITYEIRNRTEDGADIWVTWLPPPYRTEANQIKSYKLSWRKSPDLNNKEIDRPHQGVRVVAGGVTRVYLGTFHLSSRYSVAVSAETDGGWSKPYRIIITTSEEISEPVETLSSNLAFIVAPTALGLVCAVIGTYLWIRRRQIRKHRLALKKAKEGGILQAVNPFYKTNGSLCPNETSALLVDDYEVDWAWFKVGPCLGEGAFGKVLRADLRDGFVLNKARPETKTFAVKVLREEERRNLLLEIEFMKELGQHRNIVNINGCCTIASDVRLIMDYCPLGDLRNYLRRCRQEAQSSCPERRFSGSVGRPNISSDQSSDSGISRYYTRSTTTSVSSHTKEISDGKYDLSGIISEQQLLSFARQIAVGMEYIAKQRFVHRDLAARNVLVCADKSIKISDFGLTRDVYQNNVYICDSTRKIPYKWMPIETLFEHVFTTKSDVWSFAVVLWEIVTLGGFPYPGIPDKDLFRLLKDGYRMERPSNCSLEVYQLMLACWHPHPIDRPSFTDLRSKLETMLEATQAYIDLKVNLNEDYFLHSDSSKSNKDMSSREADDTDTDQGIQMSPRSSVGSSPLHCSSHSVNEVHQ